MLDSHIQMYLSIKYHCRSGASFRVRGVQAETQPDGKPLQQPSVAGNHLQPAVKVDDGRASNATHCSRGISHCRCQVEALIDTGGGVAVEGHGNGRHLALFGLERGCKAYQSECDLTLTLSRYTSTSSALE